MSHDCPLDCEKCGTHIYDLDKMRLPPSDDYEFRSPNKYGVDPIREHMRRLRGVPMDIENGDVEMRWRPPRHVSGIGRFRDLEMKEAFGDRMELDADKMLNRSKRILHQYKSKLLMASPEYDGYYIVRYSDDFHSWETYYKVENTEMDAATFDRWLLTAESWVPGHWS